MWPAQIQDLNSLSKHTQHNHLEVHWSAIIHLRNIIFPYHPKTFLAKQFVLPCPEVEILPFVMKPPARLLTRYFSLCLCLSYLQSWGVLAQSGDGGAADGVQPGSLGSDSENSESAASAGPDTGSANLSHGAVIAIAVVVSLTVVLGSEYHSLPRNLGNAADWCYFSDNRSFIFPRKEETMEDQGRSSPISTQGHKRSQGCSHAAHTQENDLLSNREEDARRRNSKQIEEGEFTAPS